MNKMELPASGLVEDILKQKEGTCFGCISCPNFSLYGLNEMTYKGKVVDGTCVAAYCTSLGMLISSGMQVKCPKINPPKPEFPTQTFTISTMIVPSDTRISACVPGSGNCKHFGLARTKNGHFVAACFKDKSDPVPLKDENTGYGACNDSMMCGVKRVPMDGLKLVPKKE